MGSEWCGRGKGRVKGRGGIGGFEAGLTEGVRILHWFGSRLTL